MFIKILLLCSVGFWGSYAQQFEETELEIPSDNIILKGTLLAPQNERNVPLVILVPGSGAVDRDGNIGPMKLENLKNLAHGLASRHIATFRYDKRVLTAVNKEGFKESEMSFDDFVLDATSVVRFFRKEKKYKKIIIAGHSQGSLVGMLAATDGVDAFISIAGAGRPIDQVISDQVMAQSPLFKDDLAKTFAIISAGNIDENFNPLLTSIFRTSVQPFLRSWMKYDPCKALEKLNIPVLLIQGTNDIQVDVIEAELLFKAKPTATLILIEHMNHVFKEITTKDRGENLASYTDKTLPVMSKLINEIEEFVDGLY
ncbi:alpha/beta hydrolase [Flavobacteriaceae bacterium F08102]|nr:alpha/beta hydrolase [Flavobacteriaceae bacterium F08102]